MEMHAFCTILHNACFEVEEVALSCAMLKGLGIVATMTPVTAAQEVLHGK